MELDGDVSTVLATLRSEVESSDLVNILYQLEDYYERKLWHQLTLALDEFYEIPDSKPIRVRIYDSFISQFQQKLNSIKVVDFLLLSYSQDKSDQQQQTLDKLVELKAKFISQLTKVLKKNTTTDEELEVLLNNEESIIYINLQISRYYLFLNNQKQSEDILDKLNDKFDINNDHQLSPKINAAFYLTKSQLCKINENYDLFYTNGLLYLSSIETESKPLTNEEKLSLCYDLCIAALLGEKIYNFGELILHDILNIIKGNDSPYYWLFNLIQYLNAGNLDQFNHWLKIGITKSPFLAKFQTFLQQKIIITSLLELISLKSTTNKKLTFKEISDFTGNPVNDVEHLIIKCFSNNLIKGYINQIDEILVVTWLQPRILNLDQVKSLYNHLVDWDSRVEQLGKEVHLSGGTVWAGL